MKFSYKLSDAIHILAYLEIFKDGDRSSRQIAASIEANPSVVRSLMSNLRTAGLIVTRQGAAGANLAKSPAEINLYDVYQAIDMQRLLHIDPKTNPNCPVGANIQTVLDQVYTAAEQAAFAKLKDTSLADVIAAITARF
ncbi:Rrf2 family transcriptional regulator [Ligilactobacillus agilis]|uniref:Rrf2 family transcriptional regulator n=1 Tax=Ligilactobacillus agilis TaxID=1601 RepID=A0A6F9XNP4_9LACO|nr:Rrf2 family transcriptional regulator [Ligilactobacillus agilis]MBM6762317.1 Rrf2 family transcriptional regulator [Ligilactobacillus agilis]UXC63892.1 Rrf2 family transcriptional regulator [Ligilactobacillus agilis]UXC65891.1 Rrf2 family transcriptional regulator [Ligilactobacillus agilis]GET06876.1 Rrf2 family transcriptional regulator [Ligilactobacillus agilis]GET13437.1 Rrf2 family transcriptional regulator [Ligilactobacillus agilis]